MNSKTVILIVLSGLLLWALIFFNTPKSYSIKSLLRIDSSNPATTDLFSMQSTGADIQQYQFLYNSRKNIKDLVNRLNLDLNIDGIDGNNKFDFSIKFYEEPLISQSFIIQFREASYSILDFNDKVIIDNAKYNEIYSSSEFEFSFSKPDSIYIKELIVKYNFNKVIPKYQNFSVREPYRSNIYFSWRHA